MEDFDIKNLNEILKNKEISALDFYGSWCAPCKQMVPIYDKVSENREDITFYKVNVDNADNKSLIEKYSIKSIPTVVLIKSGKEIGRFSGSMSEEDLNKKLKEF